eukprot:13169473-Heterocapsa_arctica.AAC.1
MQLPQVLVDSGSHLRIPRKQNLPCRPVFCERFQESYNATISQQDVLSVCRPPSRLGYAYSNNHNIFVPVGEIRRQPQVAPHEVTRFSWSEKSFEGQKQPHG